MLPDRVSNPGPLTYESGALPIALAARQKMAEKRAIFIPVVFALVQVQLFILTMNFTELSGRVADKIHK